MARFIIKPGTPEAWEIQLKQGPNTFGRGAGNDFVINDPSVSGSHCEILVQNGTVKIIDLGSTNGTFINRAPVKEAVLQPGSAVRLGGVELLFDPGEAAGRIQIISRPPTPTISPSSFPSPPPPMTTTPPAPAPAPALPRTTTVTIPSPPLPAPGNPPDVPATVGACKFHPKSPGRYWCRTCRKAFCDVCVSTRGAGAIARKTCRKCGADCFPVRSTFVPEKREETKVLSDFAILMRSLGFGFAGAILGALLWGGLAYVLGFDVTFLFAWGMGGLCGYAVKRGSQDQPGIMFSLIAVFCVIVGLVLGKLFSTLATGYFHIALIRDTVGVVAGLWTAWWMSGGDA